MTCTRPAVVIALSIAVAAGCAKQSDSAEVIARLDALENKLAELNNKPANGQVPEWVGERLNKLELAVESLTAKLDAPTATRTATPVPTATSATRRGPDTDSVYSIPVDQSPGVGPKDAKVVIVEVMEFACPACERARPFVDSLIDEFKGTSVRIAYKQFVVHPTRATIPAQAACAAHRQGKHAAYESALWEQGFKAGKFDGKPDDTDDVTELARGVGLDITKFKRDLSGFCKTYVQDEQEALRKIGIGGTPTFFVNGRVLQQRTVDEVKKMVAEEMVKADERIAGGTRAADYYESWIVGKGKTSL